MDNIQLEKKFVNLLYFWIIITVKRQQTLTQVQLASTSIGFQHLNTILTFVVFLHHLLCV